MARWPGLAWIGELLCRLAGIEPDQDSVDDTPSLTAPESLEEILLGEVGGHSSDRFVRRMVVLHFAPILESCGSRRDRVVTVIDSLAQRAFAERLAEQDQHAWVAEALVLRLAEDGKHDPVERAVNAVFDLAQRLLGSDFDPAVLPARLLVEQAGAAVFVDLWPDKVAQARLRNLLAQPRDVGADPSSISFAFRPLWTIDNKTIQAAICVPVMGGVDLTADKVEMAAPEAAAIDAHTAAQVCATLEGTAAADWLVGLPIHQSTLFDGSLREKALASYLDLDASAQERVLLEVVGIAAGCSRMKLKTALEAVRGASHSLYARFHVSESDFSDLADAGFNTVGTDVSLSQRAEAELLPMMTDFAKRADDAGLGSYVQGVSTVSLKTGAASAGFGTISGDVESDPANLANAAYPLSPEALYGRSLTETA